MIYLIVLVTFFGSTGKDPFSGTFRAPNLAVCEAKAAEQSLKATADPEVQGFVFRCITVPTKT